MPVTPCSTIVHADGCIPADHIDGDVTRPISARARVERLSLDEVRAVERVLSGLDIELYQLKALSDARSLVADLLRATGEVQDRLWGTEITERDPEAGR